MSNFDFTWDDNDPELLGILQEMRDKLPAIKFRDKRRRARNKRIVALLWALVEGVLLGAAVTLAILWLAG